MVTCETLYAVVLIIAIITGLFVVATIVSLILAILEFGWWFGQNHWGLLLVSAFIMWMALSDPKTTSPNTSVPYQSPSTLKTHVQSKQKKEDPLPQSPTVSINKLGFLQQQKAKQGMGKP